MIEKRSMTANLANLGSGMVVSIDKAISEAVVNSIQANATSIVVDFFHFEDGKIEKVVITDNGDGFTAKNLNSFFDLHSDSKKSIGGKGIGRASWFKFFNFVNIKSSFVDGDDLISISFKFLRSERDVDVDRNVQNIHITNNEVKTIIELGEYFGENCLLLNPANFKHFLLKEMVITLFEVSRHGVDFDIHINSYCNGTIDQTETIDCHDLPTVERCSDFTIIFEQKITSFTLYCLKIDSKSKNSVDTGFVAGGRTISDFNSALGLKVHAPSGKYTGKYWILLESDLFNKGRFSSEGRDRILFPEGKNLFGEDIKNDIKVKIISLITEFFDQIIPDHKQQRIDTVQEIVSLYPHYAAPEFRSCIKEVLLNSIGHIDRHDVLTKLNSIEFSREYQIKNDIATKLKEKNIADSTIEKAVAFAQSTSEQAKGALANYLWYRNAIIEQLSTYIDDNEKSEDLLHELFMRRYTKQAESTLKNCVWLLDDKFMRFSYAASEAVVKTVLKDIYNIDDDSFFASKRMDMFIRFDRPLEADSYDCVVIEFKALGCSIDERADAASQVRRKYASILRNKLPRLNNIFIYIITEIDDELHENLFGDDFRDEFTRYGYIMSYYNKNNNAYIIFVSASAIVGIAGDRHETFFNILKEDIKASDLWGEPSAVNNCEGEG